MLVAGASGSVGQAIVAAALAQEGWQVSGSDEKCYAPMMDYLTDCGIPIRSPYAAENVPSGAGVVVVGKRVPEHNSELQHVLRSGTPRSYVKTAESGNRRRHAFCGDCGTPLTSRTPAIPGMVLVKAGSLDQTAQFGKPDFAVFTIDKPSWHVVMEGVPSFERMPG